MAGRRGSTALVPQRWLPVNSTPSTPSASPHKGWQEPRKQPREQPMEGLSPGLDMAIPGLIPWIQRAAGPPWIATDPRGDPAIEGAPRRPRGCARRTSVASRGSSGRMGGFTTVAPDESPAQRSAVLPARQSNC
eukprot:Skav227987  [mRNA]  locus=scaffold390:12231:12893:+ [translate_table: standard]